MDFFSRQDDAQKKSRLFFLSFGLAMAATVVIMYFGVTLALIMLGVAPFIYGSSDHVWAFKPFIVTSLLITGVILLVSWHKVKAIKEGGGAYLAETMGGELLQTPRDMQETQLINVVEEMAVASGLPRPSLYVLRQQRSINAVTAGLDHDDTVIVVTKGALTHLDRDELQAVMAHEFAHILNGDFSLNLTMAGWLYGLLFISMKGEGLMLEMFAAIGRNMSDLDSTGRLGSSAKGGSGFMVVPALALAGGVLMVSGWLGRMAAGIVQAAFSRQREYLADAFAVQFTRNPAGLAGALKKIAAFPRHGAIKGAEAAMMKAFFIVSPARADDWLRTHPPLEDRILAIDPGWDGAIEELNHPEADIYKDFQAKYGQPSVETFKRAINEAPKPTVNKFKGNWAQTMAALGALALVTDGGRAAPAGAGLESGGRPGEDIPPELRQAAFDPARVIPLIVAVFLSDQPEAEAKQFDAVVNFLGDDVSRAAVEFTRLVDGPHKLPLLGLAAPTLKAVEAGRRQALGLAVKALIAADGRLDLFEIAACQVLKQHLDLSPKPPTENPSGGVITLLQEIRRDAAAVVSIMARLDSADPEAAFAVGMARFTQWPSTSLADKADCTSGALVRALDRLGRASAEIKKTLMLAAATTALYDDRFSDRKYLLLQALSAALDIPLPRLSVNV